MRQGIEGTAHAATPRQASQPKCSGSTPDQRDVRRLGNDDREESGQGTARECDDLPVAFRAERGGADRHQAEPETSAEHPKVRFHASLCHAERLLTSPKKSLALAQQRIMR